jgi:hypothetical protein
VAVQRERGKREQRKKKEEGRGSNRYRDKGTSLIDALLAGAIPADEARALDPARSIGHHSC